MKKFLSILLVLWCLLSGALAENSRVIDDANLFSSAEEAKLESMIADFQQETGMDFVVVTVDYQVEGYTTATLADAVYDQYGYGLGDDHSGILYLIDMYERTPYLSTAGKMIDYMSDGRIEDAHNASWDDLASGNYASAAETMIETVERYVRSGIEEGHYQYDEVTGERLTGAYETVTPMELAVSIGVALAAALIYTGSINHGYSLKGSTYDYQFRENSTVDMTDTDDRFTHTTTTRTRKAEPPSGGSSSGGGHSRSASRVHRSSGGISHGGGAGRKF